MDAVVKTPPYRLNALDLEQEITWFNSVVDARLKQHFGQDSGYASIYEIAAPDYTGSESVYAEFTRFYQLSFSERIVLLLALMPHMYPQALDVFWQRNAYTDRGFAEFGGIRGTAHSGFLPTGETALFLLSENELSKRFKAQRLFDAGHLFKQHNIVYLAAAPFNEPGFSGQLLVNEEYVDYFSGGQLREPVFSTSFPAKKIKTVLNWSDLVLDAYTMKQLNEIKIWLEHGHTLMNEWEMGKKLKPGYKALFYGPPGTGKTLTAGLFGKLTGADVYRVDLSMVISKYIGETEKNLEMVFAKAEHKNWILFFDEADALFGKRTGIADAHDKYANQEVAYLLQRLEDYNGLVILSSNMRDNVDEAFSRRLQSVIHFPVPQLPERLRLWQHSFSTHSLFAADVNLEQVAEKYVLAGGSIVNVVRYASLMALQREEKIIRNADIMEGVKKELIKEGKLA